MQINFQFRFYRMMHTPICPSVTRRHSVKTNFSPSGSQSILAFPYQMGWQYSDGDSPNSGVACNGVWKTRSSAVAMRPCDALCLYSFNTKHPAQSFIISCSAWDIPLHTIKFFSVLFSSAYWSMLQAVTNKHSMVRRRISDLHCMVVGNCFCHFAVCTSSSRSIASGAWPTVSYSASSSVNVFGTLHIQQSSIASY